MNSSPVEAGPVGPDAAPTIPSSAQVLVPVLLAGGNGERLWPLSRAQYPKQFLALEGEHSLLQQTALRAMQCPFAVPPLVVGSAAHRFMIEEQLRAIGLEDYVIMLEPVRRDTAPAAAAATRYVREVYGPEAIIFLMAADQLVGDEAAFIGAVTDGLLSAVHGHVVTFGIRPSRPETGFGYLQAGDPANDVPALTVQRFVEKPDADRALEFLSSPHYFWNGGLFMFRAELISDAFAWLEPEMDMAAGQALDTALRDDRFIELDAEAFARCRRESIDYALMERLQNLVLVPLDADWDDVGSWRFLERRPPADELDNHTLGDVVLENAQRNLVMSNHRLVAASGVDDLVIVETEDAVLVTHRDAVQDVKTVCQRLAAAQREEVEHRQRIYRPWGYYESIAAGPRFQTKRIFVKPGAKLSLQMHHHRAEHWVVVKGTAVVVRDEERFLLSENESTFIPLGTTHRLENPGMVPLEIIEVQSGAYLGEDDIVRFNDDYGRTQEAAALAEQSAAA